MKKVVAQFYYIIYIFCLENYKNIKMNKIFDVFTSKVKEELEIQVQK